MAVANKGANEHTVNTGGYETRVSQGAREHTGQEGTNSSAFEARVTQETGTH